MQREILSAEGTGILSTLSRTRALHASTQSWMPKSANNTVDCTWMCTVLREYLENYQSVKKPVIMSHAFGFIIIYILLVEAAPSNGLHQHSVVIKVTKVIIMI